MRLFLLLCVFATGFLQSQGKVPLNVLHIDEHFKKSTFPVNLQALEDTSFSLSSLEAAHELDNKTKYKVQNKANFGYSKAAFWLSIGLLNVDKISRRITVSLENSNIDSVSFWLNRGYGYELIGMAGDHLPPKKWVERSRQPSFTVTLYPGQQLGLMMRARNSHSGNMILPVRIWDANHFNLYQQAYHLVWGLYFGFLLINIALAFSAVIMLRNGLYVWYALFLISSLAYTFISFGFSYQYITGSWPGSNDQLRTTTLILLSLFMMRFAQQFLQLKKHYKKIHLALSAIMLIQITLLISSLFALEFFRTNFNVIFPWFLGLILVGNITLFVSSSMLIKAEPLRSKAFVFAFGLSLTGGIILILTDLNFLPYSMFTIHAAWLGNSIEIIIFTGILFMELKLVGDQKVKLEQIVANEQSRRIQEFFRGQEKERERIARDLHDHVAGTLVGARFLLPNPNRLTQLLDERTLTGYKRALQSLDNSIKDVRNLSHDLQPPTLNGKSLKFELLRLVSDYSTMQPNTQYKLQYDLEDFIINDDTAVALYRICQECLQNSFKHAKATEIQVVLFNQQMKVFLKIRDNGQGFDMQAPTTGIGIQNIKGRLSFTKNLTSNIESQPGKGTLVEISFESA